MRCEGIDFKQCSNAFLKCSRPQKLQQLADSLTASDLLSCGQKWLACLTPFFRESERKTCGCQHRLFFSQVEYCDNLILHRRAALDHLCQRLLDANRTIGRPSKITTIFGRKVTKFYKGKLQTVIEDLELPNPVIRTHYAHGSLKQYVRDHLCLRTDLWANLSKGFLSFSISKRGLTTNFGKQGVRTTVGIPGSGLSYTTEMAKWPKSNSSPQVPSDDDRFHSGTDSREKTLKKIWPLIFAPLCGAVVLLFAVIHGNRPRSRSVLPTATPELAPSVPAATHGLIQGRPTPELTTH